MSSTNFSKFPISRRHPLGNYSQFVYGMRSANYSKLKVLKTNGLHPKSDPRLQPMMQRIWAMEKESEEQDKEAKG
jgi:hypothetical protein